MSSVVKIQRSRGFWAVHWKLSHCVRRTYASMKPVLVWRVCLYEVFVGLKCMLVWSVCWCEGCWYKVCIGVECVLVWSVYWYEVFVGMKCILVWSVCLYEVYVSMKCLSVWSVCWYEVCVGIERTFVWSVCCYEVFSLFWCWELNPEFCTIILDTPCMPVCMSYPRRWVYSFPKKSFSSLRTKCCCCVKPPR